MYTKPYKHYKSGFEAIRAENKPKQPDNFDDFDFDKDAFHNFTQTITKKDFLQYVNKNKNILFQTHLMGLALFTMEVFQT